MPILYQLLQRGEQFLQAYAAFLPARRWRRRVRWARQTLYASDMLWHALWAGQWAEVWQAPLVRRLLLATLTLLAQRTAQPHWLAVAQLLHRLPRTLKYKTARRRLAPQAMQARVVRVIDGDTIVIEGGWKVRYIGIDAPELHGHNDLPEPYAVEAKYANARLVQGQLVRLEQDTRDKDKFDRFLRYVYVGDTCINAELVRQGYAYARPMSPNTRERDYLARCEREAHHARRGIWR